MPETKAPTPADSAADRRRSHRVNIAMPVLVRGKKGTQPFEEEAHTISVSAHGCMVRAHGNRVRLLFEGLRSLFSADEHGHRDIDAVRTAPISSTIGGRRG